MEIKLSVLFILCFGFITETFSITFLKNRRYETALGKEDSVIYEFWFQNFGLTEVKLKKDNTIDIELGFYTTNNKSGAFYWQWIIHRYEAVYSNVLIEKLEEAFEERDSPTATKADSSLYFSLYKVTQDTTIYNRLTVNIENGLPNNFLTLINCLNKSLRIEKMFWKYIRYKPKGTYTYLSKGQLLKENRIQKPLYNIPYFTEEGYFYFGNRHIFRNNKINEHYYIPYFKERYLNESCVLPRLKIIGTEKFKENDN